MKIAITGGGNPHALALARVALAAGHEVLAIGRSPMRPACFALEFAHPVRGFKYATLPLGRHTDMVFKMIEAWRPAWVVNFAAQGEGAASFPPSAWSYFYRTNVADLIELVSLLAARPWLQRFVQVGSSEVYGSSDAPLPETAPLRATSPYAHSKCCFDEFLMLSRQALPLNIVRPSNCYVSGQQLHRIIPKAMLCAALGRKLPLQGGGAARKSYLESSDLARAILAVCEGPAGEIYNVGPPEPTAIREVVERCAKHMLVPLFVEAAPARTGEDSCYWLDSTKIRALGWAPQVSWDAGLARMAAWVNAYRDELAAYPQDFTGLRP